MEDGEDAGDFMITLLGNQIQNYLAEDYKAELFGS